MDDDFLRILLAFFFITFAGIWLLGFFRFDLRRGSFFAAAEGMITGVLFRLFLIAGLAGVIAYLVRPSWMGWSSMALARPLRLAGSFISLLGLCLLAWAMASLRRSFSATLVIGAGHSLITTGPYKCVRHPMYSAFVLLWSSFFLLSANWFIGLMGMIAYTILLVFRAPREEKMLLDRYGEEYASYRARTGRFIPRPKCVLPVKEKKRAEPGATGRS